jgi:hypothetical protein
MSLILFPLSFDSGVINLIAFVTHFFGVSVIAVLPQRRSDDLKQTDLGLYSAAFFCLA